MINWTTKTERWGIFELAAGGPETGNPFKEVSWTAVFRNSGRMFHAPGFYDGDGIFKVRFSPDLPGAWTFETSSSEAGLDGLAGSFDVTEASPGNHGPVRVANTFHFAYEDGTPHNSIGTTCYAWTHQGNELEEQTLDTLAEAPFNKMRMCVFPKHYDFNHNEPEMLPFAGSLETGIDFERLNPACFRHLEKRILELQKLGIEADIILFHPYDRWGFAEMSPETDDFYLKYVVARLSAYRNVWWSLANEYDLFPNKTIGDWERFARIIMDNDPVSHLRSVHNCGAFYDYSRPWVTHCSIQRTDVYKTSENVTEWRERWRKPIVIDECTYEGDINHGWGNIPGTEMVRRFWEGYVRGGYMGHGETYMNPEEVLWWSKGGKLTGSSPARIAFLKRIAEEGPGQGMTPIPNRYGVDWDVAVGGQEGQYHLYYFGFFQPSFRIFTVNPAWTFKVEVIDTWNMTVEEVPGTFSGTFRIDMPTRQYMAVRLRRV